MSGTIPPQPQRHSYTQNKKRFGINKQQSFVQLGSTAGATDVLQLLADEEDWVVGVLEHVPRVLIIVGPHVPLLVQELEPHVLNTLLASKPKNPFNLNFLSHAATVHFIIHYWPPGSDYRYTIINPVLWIRTSDQWIRIRLQILLFSPLTFCLLLWRYFYTISLK